MRRTPYVPFPKWLYHATLGARVFATQSDVDAAGPGWVKSPALLGEASADPAASETPEVDKTVVPDDDAAPVDPEGPAVEMTALQRMNVKEARAWVAAETDLTALAEARVMEQLHPMFEDGRASILRAIDERIGQLAQAK